MVEIQRSAENNILYRKWPVADPRYIFILIHGIGAYSERWELMSSYFQMKNITSYALELKGFGETEGLKGHIDNFEFYYQDIEKLTVLAKQEYPGKKIILAGDSMGGLIAYVAAAKKPELFSGLICISPAFKNKMKFSFLTYLKFIYGLVFKPTYLVHLPFKSEEITRDKTYKTKLDGDKKEIRETTVKLLFNIVKTQLAVKNLRDIPIPVLFLLAGKDYLIDINTATEVFKRLIAEKTYKLYPDMLHALTIDAEREKVFEDMDTWLQEAVGQ